MTPGGQPQSSPVWFVWEEDEFLVYAQPRSWKMRNIRVNPQVSLHLNSDTAGGRVVTFEGSARLAEGTSPGARGCRLFGEVPRGHLGHRHDTGATGRGVCDPLRITPTRVRVY